ncbi:hypothetical protein N0V82_004335 [Gnomoniopsis sp. IMI 355080]|nr:hypothetical protein N0V82_004335 [Gnomoniopsis sp. IMI 355080]
MHLVLGEQDIKDKSKADSLAKGLAVLQITWLVVNLIARGVAGLPITQLEIATASFAVVAILTYMANMWKPKDISQPTILPGLPAGVPIASEVDHSQSLKDRLLSRNPSSKPQSRIQNDSVWLEGDVPVIFGLMSLSSLLFGGLHCIAWNYEFPSLVERDCWRVASLTSALLPLFVLALSLFSNYISNGLLESRLLSAFRAHIRPWEELPEQDLWWWHMSNPSYQSWSDEELSALLYMPANDRHWDEKPSAETIERIRIQEDSSHLSHFAIAFMRQLPDRLLPIRESWRRALEGDVPILPSVRRKELLEGQAQHMFILRLLSPNPGLLPLWDEYEASVREKIPTLNAAPSVKHIFEVYRQANIDVIAMKKLQQKIMVVSNCVNIFSSIIYALARLMIMVLIFSCLRATPERVYQNTPWIQFIPNIS